MTNGHTRAAVGAGSMAAGDQLWRRVLGVTLGRRRLGVLSRTMKDSCCCTRESAAWEGDCMRLFAGSIAVPGSYTKHHTPLVVKKR
jgi:hypothetical protein